MVIINSKAFTATSALLGVIVGAGFLGIPYVVMQSGFKIGLLHLIFICSIVGLTTLYLGEIALRTKENHQLPGYAGKYLGKTGKLLMFFAVAFGVFAALLAYLIAEGESLSYLLFGSSQYSLQMSILFWFCLSILSYYGIRSLKKGEPIGILIVFILVISISVLLSSKINLDNLSYIDLKNFFAPFGVIVFSFLGFTMIPEIKIILGEDKKSMKKSILFAYLIGFIIYAAFTFFVLGYKGVDTPEIATVALGVPFIILGTITIFNSYLALSISMIDTLKFDFGKTKARAWLCVISIPVLLLLILKILDRADFVKILGIGGVISGGLTAALILLMVRNAKLYGDRRPEYSIYNSNILTRALIAIFILGAIFELYSFFN